ncbi:MAG: hypothetical protein PHH92_10605 [Aliarcobacter skirrowii]|uniref:hypothetical protein n=1 Tax=Aliarcobacter skirrowii TaxID=28200 RepID=UPI00242BF981|nr:hypothetical protein [Aliarcobacter skirrowii]MDD3497821.1 hypothetical protein [Aliarcobacter skirrowii]
MNKINQNHKTNLTKLADYTIIKHHQRVKYKLSNNDYCIANAIYHLSNNPESRFKGWFHGKIETLGLMFNLSRASAYNSVSKLIDKKLVEKNEESGFLRTTKLWWNEFVNFEIGKRSNF